MIEIRSLTKSYGQKTAVDDLTVTIRSGVVTGFLGPNGAGKSTTMRMVLGLARPDRGEALVNGRRYTELPAPLHQVGALLDARAVHPGRTAYSHLLSLALTTGIPKTRVQQVIDLVGLSDVAGRRTRGFSLGMGQRLGIAGALLGDPETLILDEPVNGLDPDGIRWVRDLLRSLAAEGRTVFVSSHLMSEMALTADHLVVLGRGRLLADVSLEEMTAASAVVRVRTPAADRLAALLAGPGVEVGRDGPDRLSVTGRDAQSIGEAALGAGIVLHELAPAHESLEEAYLALTHDAVEYQTTQSTDNHRRAA
ncbi:MAG TPA: ABC transporter ATP-binding protein [Propionibacteriaceae bacterium]|jgi:ABC-2 type transport system ATP-binding protein